MTISCSLVDPYYGYTTYFGTLFHLIFLATSCTLPVNFWLHPILYNNIYFVPIPLVTSVIQFFWQHPLWSNRNILNTACIITIRNFFIVFGLHNHAALWPTLVYILYFYYFSPHWMYRMCIHKLNFLHSPFMILISFVAYKIYLYQKLLYPSKEEN